MVHALALRMVDWPFCRKMSSTPSWKHQKPGFDFVRQIDLSLEVVDSPKRDTWAFKPAAT